LGTGRRLPHGVRDSFQHGQLRGVRFESVEFFRRGWGLRTDNTGDWPALFEFLGHGGRGFRVDLPLPAETTSAVGADVGAAEVLRLDPGMTHLMHAYAPEPFVGRVTLLNPGVDEPALAELSNFVLEDGWERYVTGTVERWAVPGATHGTMAVEKIEVTAGVFAEVMGKGG
jgi:hypothetical protein